MALDNLKPFQLEAEYWIKYFGLYEWSIVYEQGDLGNNWAQYKTNLVGRTATLSISIENMTGFQIAKSAFHEVCHLLISDLAFFTEQYLSKNDELESEEIQHVLIRRLENTVFRESFKRRFE